MAGIRHLQFRPRRTALRIWNRAAQGYLGRRVDGPPGVFPPGPDLANSNWQLAGAESGRTDIVSTAAPFECLRSDGEKVVLDDAESVGAWRIEPVEDEYQLILSSEWPSLALTVDTAAGLVLTSARGRAAMWLFQDECVADARSVHLRYETPTGTALFYNEVTVDRAPLGTFFCTSGFGANSRAAAPSGYGGIQLRPNGAKVAIFSVWHRMAAEVATVDGSAAMTVNAHPDAHSVLFSGEGSGASIRLPFDWSAGQPVRFLTTAEAVGDDTEIAAYVRQSPAPWTHIGTIVREATGGALMGNHYAFVEDFARNGNSQGLPAGDRSPYQVHSAEFSNPWYALPSTSPLPAAAAKLTAFGPHPLESVAAQRRSVERFGIYVTTGGSAAFEPPPLGVTFNDSAKEQRPEPALEGVPDYGWDGR